jgi:hypothetical protein
MPEEVGKRAFVGKEQGDRGVRQVEGAKKSLADERGGLQARPAL